MNLKSLVLASLNPGKLLEIQSLLEPLNVQLIPQSNFQLTSAAETGFTFLENALLKARHVCRHTKLSSLADYSGLVVPALLGAPGFYSARYANTPSHHQHNIQKLLIELSTKPTSILTAHFYCVIVLLKYEQDHEPLFFTGKWEGNITRIPNGSNGFGSDPVFYCKKHNKTAAELTTTEKQSVSHRGQALRKLIAFLNRKKTSK